MKTSTEKEVKESKELTLGESIDWNNLFRIKGKKKLYTQASALQKSGMIGMRSFIDFDNVTTNINSLECLGSFEFHIIDNTKIKMDKVFDNMNAFPDEDFKSNDIILQMEKAVPQYDPNEFKPYHMKKVIGWYFEIKNKVVQ